MSEMRFCFIGGAMLALLSCGSDASQIRIPTTALVHDLAATDVGSIELWVLDQLGRDNTPIVCDGLESRSILPSDPNVQILKGPIDIDGTGPIALKGIADGKQNRVFYVDLYSQPGQLGTRVGVGCAEGQSIVGGKIITIDLQIVTAPPVSAGGN
jgi:hypothetical protein